MSYSSVLISVPGATAWVIIGLIVACCTLAACAGSPVCRAGSARELVVSPFPACRVPAHLEACDTVLSAPFYHLGRLALVPGHDVDFIDLSGVVQLRDGSACHQPLAEMLGHRLHVRGIQAQFLRDLPVGEVQPHQVEAQNPHAQWLMVPGQHRAGQIVEASMARLAQVALPVPLAFVMAIADDHGIVAVRAAHASWPTMLTHKLKTLGLVQQPREIDHLRYRYACAASKTTRSRLHPIRSETWLQRYPARATTPEPNKSLEQLFAYELSWLDMSNFRFRHPDACYGHIGNRSAISGRGGGSED